MNKVKAKFDEVLDRYSEWAVNHEYAHAAIIGGMDALAMMLAAYIGCRFALRDVLIQIAKAAEEMEKMGLL